MAFSPPSPRPTPRVSVNDLALYMVSSETAKMSIIRRNAGPQAPTVTRYRDVRPILCSYLSDPSRGLSPIVTAEATFQHRSQDPAESILRQDDARQSIEVLHAIQGMRNTLGGFDFHLAPRTQPRLSLSGVEISVRADLLVHGNTRGVDQFGAAILRMTQDDAETNAAKAKRREMGLYVATLARLHAEHNISTDRTVANRLCMSIDVQHGEAFQAPEVSIRAAPQVPGQSFVERGQAA